MRRRLRRWRGRKWAVGSFDYEDAVAFLVGRGVAKDAVRVGSIDALSMRWCGAMIDRHAPPGPLRVLHVGNYVGMSLAALSAIVTTRDPGSVVVSVDPDAQSHVIALLERYGLSGSNEVVRGYTLARSGDTDASEHVLADLERRGERFDVALIDGNHDPTYLRGELDALVSLLGEGGLLMVDDVSADFDGVRRLFREVAASGAWPFTEIGHDARIGALRRNSISG